MIEVESLTKIFGQKSAVDHVSFKVEKGEIVGFLGPNGAGKTTTMRMLTGYLPASSGTVRIDGFDVAEQSMEVRKRIGYLPEMPPLYTEMKVESYLDFVARIKSLPSATRAERIDRALEMAHLTDRRHDLIRHLSRGYRQRVGIAQAIVHDPDVLILDEPTAGLDPKQIIEVRQLIKGLAGTHTIILSTHILPEVSMTCDRVLIINHGKIVAEDTPENLTTQLRGGERLRLLVRADEVGLRKALEGIDGVREIAATALRDGGRLSVVVDVSPERDVRSQVAARIVQGGFDLYELRSERMSLEEIFLQLTTEESDESARREA
ncbi:MAG: ATP-binding cassette domain-containing protein [Acidobacteriota bacterium]|nr:ATP-binding cassette domain-containing protein [Acidobacteriota bacterium]